MQCWINTLGCATSVRMDAQEGTLAHTCRFTHLVTLVHTNAQQEHCNAGKETRSLFREKSYKKCLFFSLQPLMDNWIHMGLCLAAGIQTRKLFSTWSDTQGHQFKSRFQLVLWLPIWFPSLPTSSDLEGSKGQIGIFTCYLLLLHGATFSWDFFVSALVSIKPPTF